MNKNANSVRHLQNAAIAVLTVSAVFLLVQTPLVGDLAGKTPYELAQDWLAGDTSAETSVATDLTELALPVRVAFTNEYARYGLSAVTTLDADFELAGAFFSEALDSAGVYEACSGEKLLAALHASSIYLDLETPTPLNVLSKILGVADAPESSLMHVTRLLLYPAESGTTLYLQDTDQGFFFSKTSVSSTALREALAALPLALGDDLDRHRLPRGAIAGAKDLSHAARRDPLFELESIAQQHPEVHDQITSPAARPG